MLDIESPLAKELKQFLHSAHSWEALLNLSNSCFKVQHLWHPNASACLHPLVLHLGHQLTNHRPSVALPNCVCPTLSCAQPYSPQHNLLLLPDFALCTHISMPSVDIGYTSLRMSACVPAQASGRLVKYVKNIMHAL